MNKLKRLAAILGLSVLGSSAIAQAANAGEFDVIHKFTDSVAGKTYVYFPAVTAGQPVTGLTSPKAAALKVLTLNNCGIGKVSKSTTSPVTNIVGSGSTVNFSAKTTGADPTCTASTTTPGTFVSSWTGSVGDVLDGTTKYFIKGGTAAGAISVNVTSTGTVTSKANACGFLRVTTSTTRPMTNFSVGTTAYTLAALPAVTNPMICKKVGVNSFTYIPAP